MNEKCHHNWTVQEYEGVKSRYCDHCNDFEIQIRVQELSEKCDQLTVALEQEISAHKLEKYAHERTLLHKTNLIDEMKDLHHTNHELIAENTKLRGILARSKEPCLYCGLTDMSKCKSGFPGCGRMDDLIASGYS